jgi:hypothetical protein
MHYDNLRIDFTDAIRDGLRIQTGANSPLSFGKKSKNGSTNKSKIKE